MFDGESLGLKKILETRTVTVPKPIKVCCVEYTVQRYCQDWLFTEAEIKQIIIYNHEHNTKYITLGLGVAIMAVFHSSRQKEHLE